MLLEKNDLNSTFLYFSVTCQHSEMIKLTIVEFEVAQIIQNNPKTLKDIREELFRSKFRTNVFHSWIEPIRNLVMYLNPEVFEIDGEIVNGNELVTLLLETDT